MIPLGVLASRRADPGGGGALTADYVGVVTTGADGTTYTFTDAPIGAAASDRTVIVAFSARSAGQPTITDVTIAGVTASLDHQAVAQGSVACLASAAVPAGTTGTVVVTLSSGAVRGGIAVWRVTGDALAVADTDDASGTSGSVSVSIPPGGVGIHATTGSLSTTVFTFTNSTEDYDVQMATEAGRMAGGRMTGDTVTFTASSGTPQTIAVAYGPA